MKRDCKHIDITNADTIKPFVADCCRRHKKRYDFRQMFIEHGMSKQDYKIAIKTNNFGMFDEVITNITIDVADQIKNRKLRLTPVRIREIPDRTTGKIRLIGNEDAMQQIFDYIAVYSSMDIFKRRIVREQCSSIPKRRQLYGIRILKKWIKNDYDALKYATRHNLHYISKCKYFSKLDIRLCHPSADSDVFMLLFSKDCANDDIIWLWNMLFQTHKVDGYTGFMIGALISQWAAQYMISFIYRYAKSKHYTRRKRSFKMINHMLLFMDDMVLFGSNRKILFAAIHSIIKYVRDTFGWIIKPTWSICELSSTPLDMMGFVAHRDGSVTIRDRNFIKSRRIAMRYMDGKPLNLAKAKRSLSYKGFYDHSNSRTVTQLYDLDKMFHNAALVVSEHDRRINENRKNRFWKPETA